MSDKGVSEDAVHQENQVVGKTSKRKALAAHFKRFWWAYLIGLCAIVALVVPLIIFVGISKIAQEKIDQVALEVLGITASDTQSSNFTISIDSIVHAPGGVSATVDAFDGFLYLEDWNPHRPFVKVRFPETTNEKYQVVKLSQFAPIEDLEAFTAFNTWLLANDSLRVTVAGNTGLHVPVISHRYEVNFKKTITMPGLRMFQGTEVSNPRVNLFKIENFNGTVTVPNYSNVAFEIGNVTFYNYLAGEDIGEAYIDNMYLRPGNNSFPMRAKVNQSAIIKAMGQRPACGTGILPFSLRGKNVVNKGQVLPYFRDALASANQTVNIDVGAALRAAGIVLPCSNTTTTN